MRLSLRANYKGATFKVFAKVGSKNIEMIESMESL